MGDGTVTISTFHQKCLPLLPLVYVYFLLLTISNISPSLPHFPYRSGVWEQQHHLHLQRSGDELQRGGHRGVCQPDVSGQRRAGQFLREPRPGRGQWDGSVLPEQPEVTRRLHFPEHLAGRDTASPGSGGGAAAGKVKRDQWLFLSSVQWSSQSVRLSKMTRFVGYCTLNMFASKLHFNN